MRNQRREKASISFVFLHGFRWVLVVVVAVVVVVGVVVILSILLRLLFRLLYLLFAGTTSWPRRHEHGVARRFRTGSLPVRILQLLRPLRLPMVSWFLVLVRIRRRPTSIPAEDLVLDPWLPIEAVLIQCTIVRMVQVLVRLSVSRLRSWLASRWMHRGVERAFRWPFGFGRWGNVRSQCRRSDLWALLVGALAGLVVSNEVDSFDFENCVCSEREFQRGDEIAWYADGDKLVRNEYNPATAYAFGILSRTS